MKLLGQCKPGVDMGDLHGLHTILHFGPRTINQDAMLRHHAGDKTLPVDFLASAFFMTEKSVVERFVMKIIAILSAILR